MQKIEILEEQANLTRSQDRDIPQIFAKCDCDRSLHDESLTADEKALLDRRLAAGIKDLDAGSSWEEVEMRLRVVLSGLRRRQSTARSVFDKHKHSEL